LILKAKLVGKYLDWKEVLLGDRIGLFRSDRGQQRPEAEREREREMRINRASNKS